MLSSRSPSGGSIPEYVFYEKLLSFCFGGFGVEKPPGQTAAYQFAREREPQICPVSIELTLALLSRARFGGDGRSTARRNCPRGDGSSAAIRLAAVNDLRRPA